MRNLKRLYDVNQRRSAPGDAIEQEQEFFRAWRIDPAEIERRRTGIVERGRVELGEELGRGTQGFEVERQGRAARVGQCHN